MSDLFVVHIDTGSEVHTIPYNSIDECLHDAGLKVLLQNEATCSVRTPKGDRLTRDVHTWPELEHHVTNNRALLDRMGMRHEDRG